MSLLVLTIIGAFRPSGASGQVPIPPNYQDLYFNLYNDLSNFNATLGTPSPYPVIYAGDLVVAAGDSGPGLANTTGGAGLQINALKALGVQAVMIQVGFPILDPNFYTFIQTQTGFPQVTYAQMQSYYQLVAQNVRAAGLKLIVENDVLLSNDVQAGWAPASGNYYATLDWPTFEARHAQCALNIVQTMQPDYLVVLESPDTEAVQVSQPNFGTVSGATDYLTQVLTVLAPVRSTVKIGAGVENYLIAQPGFAAFISSFLSLPGRGLDFIDMQIYPINDLGGGKNFLQNALSIANMALAAGKPISITEAWSWKLRDSEWNNINYDAMRARDPFNFWAPLDAYFIQTLENLANYTHMLFMAPEGANYLFAYQPFNQTTAGWTPGQMLSTEVSSAQQANRTGAFTVTGMSYYNYLVQPPDISPPTTPTLLTANAPSSSTAALSWTPSTDNVGVASYHVWRDGVPMPDTAFAYFTDSGLSNYTTYNYQVQAFDLANNSSQPITFSITTQNSIPPSTPVVTGAAVSPHEITLTWTPASCPAPISSYRIFEGASPTSLQQLNQVPGTQLSANLQRLTPGTTYYFAVQAAQRGLLSEVSPLIAVTTLLAPAPPTNVSAVALSSSTVQISWSPSTGGGLPIGFYLVVRGTSPTQLNQEACFAYNTQCADNSVSPQTTYYYGVAAADTSKSFSPVSNIVAVTTP